MGGSSLADAVAIAGDYAFMTVDSYLKRDDYQVQAFDIANPAAPRKVGTLHTTWHGRAIDVDDDLAYIAAGDDGLRIVDVSDPAGTIPPSPTPKPVPVFLPSLNLGT